MKLVVIASTERSRTLFDGNVHKEPANSWESPSWILPTVCFAKLSTCSSNTSILQSQRSTNRPFPLLSSAKRELGKNRLDCQRPCYCAFHEANDVPWSLYQLWCCQQGAQWCHKRQDGACWERMRVCNMSDGVTTPVWLSGEILIFPFMSPRVVLQSRSGSWSKK